VHPRRQPQGVYVVYDPAVNAVDTATSKLNAYCLDPSTWTLMIPEDRNFKVSTPIDSTKVDEGGDEADFGTIQHEMLLGVRGAVGQRIGADNRGG
jgi:hypothetical protein